MDELIAKIDEVIRYVENYSYGECAEEGLDPDTIILHLEDLKQMCCAPQEDGLYFTDEGNIEF